MFLTAEMLFPMYAITLEENTYTESCLARALSEGAFIYKGQISQQQC